MLAAALLPAISTSSEANDEAQSLPSKRAMSHPLYEKSTLLLGSSREIIKTYRSVTQEISAVAESLQIGQDWDGDSQKLLAVLGFGREIAEENIVDLLLGKNAAVNKVALKTSNSSKHRNVWSEFSTTKCDKDMGESWALVARRTEKSVSRLGKCIPQETDQAMI